MCIINGKKYKEVDYKDPVEAGKMRQLLKAAKKEFPEWFPDDKKESEEYALPNL